MNYTEFGVRNETDPRLLSLYRSETRLGIEIEEKMSGLFKKMSDSFQCARIVDFPSRWDWLSNMRCEREREYPVDVYTLLDCKAQKFANIEISTKAQSGGNMECRIFCSSKSRLSTLLVRRQYQGDHPRVHESFVLLDCLRFRGLLFRNTPSSEPILEMANNFFAAF